MQIAIAGSSGFLGSALTEALERNGHRVRPLLRPSSKPREGGIWWDPDGGTIQAEALEGIDAVVNLAGESIGASRWTPAFKKRMRDSRVRSTSLLARTIANLERKPGVFLSSSASGYYGDRGDEIIDEDTPPGDGFLPDLCVEWEKAAAAAEVRTVITRSTLVLHPSGGLLKRLLLPFKMGVGGRLGSGRQWMPWITLDDEIRAMVWLLEHEGTEGPYNLTAPNPVRNTEFTRALAAAVKRPAVIPVPRFALSTIFGEEATKEAFLASQRIVPSRLEKQGFEFSDPQIGPALATMLR